MITIRPAVQSDIDEIMGLERETFGELGESAMATQSLMEGRISLCNTENFTGFWVAEYKGVVVGDIIFQPINLDPHDCTSWAMATDDGNLETTFDLKGENIYIVSLAVSKKAPVGASALLMHTSLAVRLLTHKHYYMVCSRMPGFRSARDKALQEQKVLTAEEYWQSTRKNGEPRDWMLRECYDMFGEKPFKLLKDGFLPDKESGGHGVLFALEDPLCGLQASSIQIYRSGTISGRRMKKGEK